jgi:hypothetical protein
MLEGGRIGIYSSSCSSLLSVGIFFIAFSWEIFGVNNVGTNDVELLSVVAFVGSNDVDVTVGIAVVGNGADSVGGGAVVVDTIVLLLGIKIVAFGDSWKELIILMLSCIIAV